MEGACQDEVVVGANLIEPPLMKRPVVDEASCLVDDYKCEDRPVCVSFSGWAIDVRGKGFGRRT
jgi:hypothetical protein